MATVAHQEIIATCNAHNLIPPEGASESEKNRLFELCGLNRRCQPGKDSLHARFKLANLKGAYYTKDEKGNKCQILKNSDLGCAMPSVRRACFSRPRGLVPSGSHTQGLPRDLISHASSNSSTSASGLRYALGVSSPSFCIAPPVLPLPGLTAGCLAGTQTTYRQHR